ncbi:xanthine dehydrogenase molybdopterin binding subunit [Brenneria izbisi]|uniref:Xanthine dehydrogenase molybdopterin binding subunit n=1 Tax=Brenneria izbisi TaxID=2939450 RepID=A0AA41XV88_9GAMM|nr:xanthine dehydrogenase molybdopterin binding subunit [Brenneria izbisi]MCV9879393.1 xanthine dehydrogenase molybdopterin binding subunit [Brenneria izbisi]MCV9882593.1 xanthine dehydrogenase molybdopterin binding subunit [Brenneria izbisi]
MSETSFGPEVDDRRQRFTEPAVGQVGKSLPHESAERHVSGEALYIDDRPGMAGALHLAPRLSEHAHARILGIDIAPCYRIPGVEKVITWQDVPGELDVGPLVPGDPLLARDEVTYLGQVVLVVAAIDEDTARRAAAAAVIDYQPLPALLDVEEALARGEFVDQPHQHRRGDADAALAAATHRLTGRLHIGGQEHFYLEGQAAMVAPEENGMLVYSSTQNPTEVQKLVASVLGLHQHDVTVDTRRMGGGFGGKETQAAGIACLCAVAARITGRMARMRLNRRDDMLMTGKRHPFLVRYQVGYDDQGLLLALKLDLIANCGHSADLSGSIVDRAMFHADNAYYLSDVIITGYRCRTHTASNTAFRGFGGPQGMMAIENIMDAIARERGRDALAVRRLNYYRDPQRNVTHYGQQVEDNLLEEMTEQLCRSAQYAQRRAEIDAWNRADPVLRRGLALTPVKFGISFTASFLNQAGALLLMYTDGTLQLNHGGTEMGQGLHTKVIQVVASVLGVSPENIRITATSTGKVPNTSPTAASSGTDLNGKAAEQAALTLKQRLVDLLCREYGLTASDIDFNNGLARAGERLMTLAEVAKLAHFRQVSLASQGYYSTPTVHYDRSNAHGSPFYYFAYGMACAEVVVDTLTGEYRVTQVDILHDVGASLNPAIDIGQVEGGFVQGMGWLTSEELVWNDEGRLLTDGPASYKIPTFGDRPMRFNVRLVENRANPKQTVFHSKAVGEPPFMLAIAVWCALGDAVAGPHGKAVRLDAPATPERVLAAIEAMRS